MCNKKHTITAAKGLPKQELLGQAINHRYLIRKWLGGGAFGDVYEAEDLETHQILALKFEINHANPQLPNEYKCYKTLEGMCGIPTAYDLITYKKSKVMIMDRMGVSLETLFKRCGRKFSLKTVLMITDQLLRIIEYVHSCGIIHRDIKPHNFIIGRGKSQNQIHIIDFGVSTSYIDSKTKEHAMYSANNGLVGTANYVSINTHLGDQQSRRDDLESIAYCLIRFMTGTLPWHGIKINDKDERNDKIVQVKIQTSSEVLCQGLPREFKQFLDYIKSLRYDETPRYSYYRQMFNNLFIKKGFIYDGLFDWDEAAAIHRPLPCSFLLRAAARYQRINERKPRKADPKLVLPVARNIFCCQWRV